MIKNTALQLTKKILGKIGYSINNLKHPIAPIGNDPRELSYLSDLPYSLQHLPFEFGYGMRFFSFKRPKYHPFILALQYSKNKPFPEESAFMVLKEYNQLLPLCTANDFLGLNSSQACFRDDSHPFEYCYPWSTSTPQETKAMYLEDIYNENIRYGLPGTQSLELINASDEKIKCEAKRLLGLRYKIEREGFKPSAIDSLGCFVLVHGDNFRWYVHGGQHRAAVLITMGHVKAPIVVRRIIRREDAEFWPNVQRGIFSVEQGLVIFDALFDRRPPHIARNWMNHVDKNYYYDM